MAIDHQEATGKDGEDMRGAFHASAGSDPQQAAPSRRFPIRWVAHRKAEIVADVSAGKLTLEQACALHAISIEEYESWLRNIALFGLTGLQVSRVQRRRPLRQRPGRNDAANSS